jgi:hypothetical protein
MIAKYRKSILFSLLICFLLFLPGDKLPKQNLLPIAHADKVLHACLFLFLEWMLLYESRIFRISKNSRKVIHNTLVAVVFALFTELVQYTLIAERDGNMIDYFADLIGIMAGIASYRYFQWFTNRFSPSKS